MQSLSRYRNKYGQPPKRNAGKRPRNKDLILVFAKPEPFSKWISPKTVKKSLNF
jgi:hypothetical protein